MKILCPITHQDDIDNLDPKRFGTEFFCGYLPMWWVEKYNNSQSFYLVGNMSTPINNRNGIKANFVNYSDLQTAVQKVSFYSTNLFLTLNAKYYPDYVYPDLIRYIAEVYNAGIRKMIVSDIGMISYLSNHYSDIGISVSCLNQVTNSMAVQFYTRFNNVERIVFPRHISTDEIMNIIKNYPSLDFEYFIFSNKCLYDDGYCRGVHEFTPICKDLFFSEFCAKKGTPIPEVYEKKLRKGENVYRDWTHNEILADKRGYCTSNFACSACSLTSLAMCKNVKSVKLSIRGHDIDERIRQVGMAREAILCAENGGREANIQKVISHAYGKPDLCNNGMSCMMV